MLLEKILTDLPDTIFYLASIVSGEAEANFSKGWDVNIHAFWSFLSHIRDQNLKSEGQYKPKIIFYVNNIKLNIWNFYGYEIVGISRFLYYSRNDFFICINQSLICSWKLIFYVMV